MRTVSRCSRSWDILSFMSFPANSCDNEELPESRGARKPGSPSGWLLTKQRKTFGLALVHAGLGEMDQAFRRLEEAIELRAPLVIVVKVDPRFDLLHKDARFGNLLRKMNLLD
jgi:hypothetical protein